MSSYCYTVSERGHKVYADVTLKPGAESEHGPVLICFHGGGIIQGSRREEYLPAGMQDCTSSSELARCI